MATLQVVQEATTFHEEKPIKKVEETKEVEDIKNAKHGVQEEPKDEAAETVVAAPKAEAEVLADEVETKAVVKEEQEKEAKVSPLDDETELPQPPPSKLVAEPCVEEETKAIDKAEAEPIEVAKEDALVTEEVEAIVEKKEEEVSVVVDADVDDDAVVDK